MHRQTIAYKVLPSVLILFVVLAVARFHSINFPETHGSEPDPEIKSIAIRYIKAEYGGDKETLLSLTREEAYKAVKNGEIDIFENHILDKIISISGGQDDSGISYASLTVSGITPRDWTPSTYYENMEFKKINGKWFIVKVERDI